MNILADASLPGLIEAFPDPFKITLYQNNNEVPHLLKNQDLLLCRSTLKVNAQLLGEPQLSLVATASSGSDHIDKEYLRSHKITVLDAKGSNAIAVADYVLATFAFLYKEGLLKGKKVGIIGLGYVGSVVYERLNVLCFDLCCYDPVKELTAPHFTSCPQEHLYDCDILCIHAQLHDEAPYPSINLLNSHFLQHLKPHCIVINAARGNIVNEEDLLSNKTPLIYCTDVYANEPKISKALVSKALLCTPHIAGHSLEAKYNAVNLVSKKVHHLLGLPLPKHYSLPLRPPRSKNTDLSWQELALTLYNPLSETLKLKNALCVETAFLSVRKQHRKRHDFNTYFNDSFNKKIQKLFT